MRKFIIKTSVFTLPFFLLFAGVKLFYKTGEGDLLRLGYIMDFDSYRSQFGKDFKMKPACTALSENDFNTKSKYDIMLIGDSYSEQPGFGFKDQLARQTGKKILHYDLTLTNKNPLQALYSLARGNVLDSLDIQYIVFESVERAFINRYYFLDTAEVTLLDSLIPAIRRIQDEQPGGEGAKEVKFFSDLLIKVPLVNLQYLYQDKPGYSQTYKVETTGQFFTHGSGSNHLLFYAGDLDAVPRNDSISVVLVNDLLNEISRHLKTRGIQLIVMPAPDKYSFYYDYIVHKELFPEPRLFEHFSKVNKEYKYLDSKAFLHEHIRDKTDIYFYDDTHWSPVGTRMIAEGLGILLD